MFIYAAMDRAAGVSDSAIVTLTIAPCPSPPTAPPPFIVITPGPDNYSAPCNGSITVGGAGGLLSNDRSNSTNATLEVVSVGRPFPGGVIGAWDKGGGFTYTPPAGFQGALSRLWLGAGGGACRGHPRGLLGVILRNGAACKQCLPGSFAAPPFTALGLDGNTTHPS